MKIFLRVFFLLIPVFANSQNSEQEGVKLSYSDSIIIPSYNRKWTVQEFEGALNLLISRFNGPSGDIITIDKNKELFEKVTEIKNYWFLDSTGYTPNERFRFNLSVQSLLQKVFIGYYQKSEVINGRLSYDGEIVAFMGIVFELTKNQMKMAEEFMKGTPNLTQVQLDGLKQAVEGYVMMEEGGLIILEKEYTTFSEASVCKFSKSFIDFYLFMYPRIAQESRTKFDVRIANLVKTHPIPCVRETLQATR